MRGVYGRSDGGAVDARADLRNADLCAHRANGGSDVLGGAYDAPQRCQTVALASLTAAHLFVSSSSPRR